MVSDLEPLREALLAGDRAIMIGRDVRGSDLREALRVIPLPPPGELGVILALGGANAPRGFTPSWATGAVVQNSWIKVFVGWCDREPGATLRISREGEISVPVAPGQSIAIIFDDDISAERLFEALALVHSRRCLLVGDRLETWSARPRAPEVVTFEPPTIEGGLAPEVVRWVTRRRGRELERCGNGSAEGRGVIRINIGVDGAVTRGEVIESTLALGINECIAANVRSWTFPRPDGRRATEVVLPFEFAQKN